MGMSFQLFQEELFSRGKKYGFEEMELYQNKNRSFKLRVFEQEVDHYALNVERGVSLRAQKEGKMGYAYTERMDQESIELLLEEVDESCQVVKESEEQIFSGSGDYKDVAPYNEELNQITPEEKMKLVLALEKEARERDSRITTVNHCLFSNLEVEEKVVNSSGLELDFKNNIAYMYLSVLAREDNIVKTAADYFLSRDFSQFDSTQVAHSAVDEALAKLGAGPVASGSYPVVLRHDVVADLLSAFSSTLSAENVQKGLSLFQNKLGEKVGTKQLTVYDDPFLEEGFRTRPFDAEGVASEKKCVIEEGKLNTFLHNLKTARRAGVESTGNAYRDSHRSYVDISPTNLYIKPGDTDREEIISSVEDGLLITELQGLHSGTNSVSGDFSLSAAGFVIKNGNRERPLEQVTIAGNFLELLQDIRMVGSDLKLALPGSSHIGAPSIKIGSLDVAGE